MKTHYVVRFVCYQYNSGRADNGEKLVEQRFDQKDPACVFAIKVKSLAVGSFPNGDNKLSHEFAKDYVWDGFVVRLVGVFEITETRIV